MPAGRRHRSLSTLEFPSGTMQWWPHPIAKLRLVVEAGPPLRLVVLFGSQATSRATAESDLDIGIVPINADLTAGSGCNRNEHVGHRSRSGGHCASYRE